MTSPEAMGVELLDQGALNAAELAWTGDSRLGLYPEQKQALANAIHAYLSALPTPAVDGLEVVRFSWLIPPGGSGRIPCVREDGDWVEFTSFSSLSTQVQRLTEENEALKRDAGEPVVAQYALSAAEARIKALEEGMERIAAIAERNYGRQNEKLADIAPIARRALSSTESQSK